MRGLFVIAAVAKPDFCTLLRIEPDTLQLEADVLEDGNRLGHRHVVVAGMRPI